MAKKRGSEMDSERRCKHGYFHGIANGRKKKCAIFSLEDEGREICGPV
jgi:hypothetical protein